ncbi:MAG: class I mannose-6-phosphate isomerase, partial [Clostridium sp.]|nr:class I mannose-6-phosphate isomerase [Clostridium sp.]
MYPIKFKNLYYEKIWGGRDFKSFRDNLPDGNIGESWDVACHKNGISIVENGKFKGMRFDEIIKTYGHDIIGNKVSIERFPLLVKLINSRENLSVQVHPDDKYALKNDNDYGKTEAWYIIDAKPGAKLIVGTKSCNKEMFYKAIIENRCEEFLNYIDVKKGDAFLIKSGMIHAICGGTIILEIQQNSDITYRVYDYGRPRKLHIEKAIDIIDFSLQAENLSNNEIKNYNGYSLSKLCENQY